MYTQLMDYLYINYRQCLYTICVVVWVWCNDVEDGVGVTKALHFVSGLLKVQILQGNFDAIETVICLIVPVLER